MKRPVRGHDGKYTIKGKKYPELFGSRIQVFNGTAYKTEGELTKPQLMMNKWGRIVSVLKYHTAKKEKRLEKAGYFAKKGKFGYVKKSAKKGSKVGRKTRKVKGGEVPKNELPLDFIPESDESKKKGDEARLMLEDKLPLVGSEETEESAQLDAEAKKHLLIPSEDEIIEAKEKLKPV